VRSVRLSVYGDGSRSVGAAVRIQARKITQRGCVRQREIQLTIGKPGAGRDWQRRQRTFAEVTGRPCKFVTSFVTDAALQWIRPDEMFAVGRPQHSDLTRVKLIIDIKRSAGRFGVNANAADLGTQVAAHASAEENQDE